MGTDPDEPQLRRLHLTPAASIAPRRVHWLWADRIAYGTLALLAGREGLGKSTLGYKLAADVTNGTLQGEDYGNPRAVLVCAAEDSWEHTIVPRLIAAGANLHQVYRVEIETWEGMHVGLSLPRDWAEAETAAKETGAALMILDPLMSVIDSRLDTHRDREVRTALEPLAALADRCRMAILGLIHHNKSGSTDALQLVMGSKAFSAVARSVHTCIPDPDDETLERRLFATSKNNLGRLDLPVLGFTITGHAVETVDDGLAWTSRLHWTGPVSGAMHEIMTRASDPDRTAAVEAADWLVDYLTQNGGEVAKLDIEKAGRSAGHTPAVLRRARERLSLGYRSAGFPRQTYWSLPDTTVPDDTTADTTEGPKPSHANDRANGTVVPVVSEGDTTVTQLGLTWENAESDPRAYARAQGDTPTDTTDSVTRLESRHSDSRASRASRDTGYARAREPYAQVPGQRPPFQPGNTHGVAPDSDLPPPVCDDCGYPVDHPGHQRTCEE